jgi:CRISPR-associated protein Cmr2
MTHLFLFTIGPVQNFIAQARKVHDLAAGSKLLSKIIHWAIDKTKNECPQGFTLQFPAETVEDCPNRFLAIVIHPNPQELGKIVEEYIKDKFQDYAKSLMPELYQTAFVQLQDFPQIHWVSIPYNNETGNGYLKKYEYLEQLMGGIKNLRPISTLVETGRKCSLNGEYNVVIYRKKEKDEKQSWEQYTKIPEVKILKGNSTKEIAVGEGLCAISYLKRKFELPEKQKFEATCEIAYKFALDNISKIEDIDKLKNIDEQYLYSDSIISKEDESRKSDIYKYRKNIQSELTRKKLKLHKYYALVVFDADNMGKWLSGEYANEAKSFQTHISEKLGEFAKKAEEIVAQKGQTVYAGGDDYIGFVALEYLNEVLKDFRKGFKELSNNLQGKKADAPDFTFSAGVVIAHYKTPLNYVLAQARAAEHTAKENDRDSVAITVLKRSGEIHRTCFKWYNDKIFLFGNLWNIVLQLKKGDISNKFITNFEREFSPVIGESENAGLNVEILRLELKRLISNDHIYKDVENLLTEFSRNNKNKIRDFIFALNIADFISREINLLTETPCKQ